MPQEPVPPDPGRDEDPRPVPAWPAWMDDPAYLALRAGDEDPGDPGVDEDPDDDLDEHAANELEGSHEPNRSAHPTDETRVIKDS